MESKVDQASIQKITSITDEMRILHLIYNCSVAYNNATSQWAKDYWSMTQTILQKRYVNILQKVN